MYRKYCDRCGKLIRVDEDALAKYSIHRTGGPEEEPFIHLCSKCEDAFEEWLNPTLEPWGSPECGKKMVSTPGVQFYESLGEKIFVEGSDPPGDPWVYRTVEGLNAIRQTLDEKQSEQIWRAQELISELYKENKKLKGEK